MFECDKSLYTKENLILVGGTYWEKGNRVYFNDLSVTYRSEWVEMSNGAKQKTEAVSDKSYFDLNSCEFVHVSGNHGWFKEFCHTINVFLDDLHEDGTI